MNKSKEQFGTLSLKFSLLSLLFYPIFLLTFHVIVFILAMIFPFIGVVFAIIAWKKKEKNSRRWKIGGIIGILMVIFFIWGFMPSQGSKYCVTDSDCMLQKYGCHTGCWNKQNPESSGLIIDSTLICFCATRIEECKCIDNECRGFFEGEEVCDSC